MNSHKCPFCGNKKSSKNLSYKYTIICGYCGNLYKIKLHLSLILLSLILFISTFSIYVNVYFMILLFVLLFFVILYIVYKLPYIPYNPNDLKTIKYTCHIKYVNKKNIKIKIWKDYVLHIKPDETNVTVPIIIDEIEIRDKFLLYFKVKKDNEIDLNYNYSLYYNNNKLGEIKDLMQM